MIQAQKDKCETKWVLPTLMNFAASPDRFAYALAGVSVGYSARGVPFDPYWYNFANTFGRNAEFGTGPTDEAATICLPVLVNNPVSCNVWSNEDSPIGSKFTFTTDPAGISVNSDGCTINSPPLQVDPWLDPGASVAGACTDGHEVGTATIVIGSSRHYSEMLTALVNGSYDYSTQAVASCAVDVRSAIGFRSITLSRLKSEATDLTNEEAQIKAAFTITGDTESTCVPVDRDGNELMLSDVLLDTALATAAAASWQLLAENRLVDGFLETIIGVGTTLAPSGITTLEDILGTATGIALGMYWGRADASDILDPVVIAGGVLSSMQLRVGPGELWAIVYCVPPLFSAFLLLYLLWTLKLGKPRNHT
jgi:hypothetical protein